MRRQVHHIGRNLSEKVLCAVGTQLWKRYKRHHSYAKDLGVPADWRAVPGDPPPMKIGVIRLQALRSGPVSEAITNTNNRELFDVHEIFNIAGYRDDETQKNYCKKQVSH